jgi:hypothetical protein
MANRRVVTVSSTINDGYSPSWTSSTNSFELKPFINSVDNIIALRLLTGNLNQVINLDGYLVPGDKGGGLFYWSDTSTETDNAGLVVKGPATVGRWKRQHNDSHYDVRWFGAVADWNGTTGTNNLVAFNAALAAIYASNNNRQSKLVADGLFFLSGQLDIRQSILFEGAGRGSQPELVSYKTAPGTMLVFPQNVDGVHLWHDPAFGPRADRSTIRNLTIYCKDAGTTSGAGLTLHVTCHIENVTVQGFGGHNILADTSSSGNVDSAVFSNIITADSKADGFHLYGGDSNASFVSGVESSFNAGYGFYDKTFGNTYIGCTAQGNAISNYHTEQDSNRANFFGCYCEEGPLNQMLGQCSIIGGTFNDTMLTTDSTAFLVSFGTSSRAPFQYRNVEGATAINTRIGEPGTVMRAFSWATLSGGSDADRISMTYLPTPKAWALLNNSYYRRMLTFPTAQAHMRQPTAWCENGIMLGRDDTGAPIIFTSETSPPLTDYSGSHLTYERGDTIWQALPAAGGSLGKRCITSGTQGTLNSGLTTAATTSGLATITVSAYSELQIGQYIAIVGVTGTKKIIDQPGGIGTYVFTLSSTCNATVSAGAVSFVAATFEHIGTANDVTIDWKPQTTTRWKDGPDTGTTSTKTATYSRRRDTQTTTATASQILDDGGTFAGEDFTLPDNAITRIKVTLLVKKAATAAGGTIDLQGDFYRDAAGNAVRIGADIGPVYNLTGSTLDGTTAALVINGTKVEVQVSPESADTLNWGIYRTHVIGGAAAAL